MAVATFVGIFFVIPTLLNFEIYNNNIFFIKKVNKTIIIFLGLQQPVAFSAVLQTRMFTG